MRHSAHWTSSRAAATIIASCSTTTPLLSGGVWNCRFKNKDCNNRCCLVMFFRMRWQKKKKMSVTCANLRGWIDRKCTVICCAYVLSQTTSVGCCRPIIGPSDSPIITLSCKVPLKVPFHFFIYRIFASSSMIF